ncbi:MAG: AAA family ATPase [Geminicoccaceae bacterium]
MGEKTYVAGNPALNGTDHLVIVSGCSGGGKSSLLAEMSRRGYPVMPEPGRQIVKEQLFVGGPGLPWVSDKKFAELCVSRGVHFFNSAQAGDRPVLFDRSILDNICALMRGGTDIPPYLTSALKRYRYASRVFLVPPWPELFAADAERRHSFADAVAEYEHLLACYPANGYEVVLIPKASVGARADFLEEMLARDGLSSGHS